MHELFQGVHSASGKSDERCESFEGTSARCCACQGVNSDSEDCGAGERILWGREPNWSINFDEAVAYGAGCILLNSGSE